MTTELLQSLVFRCWHCEWRGQGCDAKTEPGELATCPQCDHALRTVGANDLVRCPEQP